MNQSPQWPYRHQSLIVAVQTRVCRTDKSRLGINERSKGALGAFPRSKNKGTFIHS